MALSPISKLPLGILGMFGIKSLGRYPNALEESLALRLEAIGLYAAAHGEDLFTSLINITALNNNVSTIVVPQTEIWYVSTVSTFLFSNVTGTATGRAALITGGAGINVVLGSNQSVTAGTQSMFGGPPVSTNPFWADPGATFGFWVDAFTNTPQYRLNLRILRFPI